MCCPHCVLLPDRKCIFGGRDRRPDRKSAVLYQSGQDGLPQRPLRPGGLCTAPGGCECGGGLSAESPLGHSGCNPAAERSVFCVGLLVTGAQAEMVCAQHHGAGGAGGIRREHGQGLSERGYLRPARRGYRESLKEQCAGGVPAVRLPILLFAQLQLVSGRKTGRISKNTGRDADRSGRAALCAAEGTAKYPLPDVRVLQ